ncbi:MAG: hypothetical protein LPK13_09875 [Marinobacter sp.]|nr:hypothetical protein [Marinobacter sp.]MDX5472824.1 hypothetical protein [Marinobacter sp.]
MNKDMLARIKSRNQRPKVERDISFGTQSPASQVPEPDLEEQSNLQPAQPADPAQASERESPSLEAQLVQLIQVGPRRNIRLEETLDKEIGRFVQEQDLTIETLLEACYLVLRDHDELKARVVSQAAERLAERKEAGKLRRIYSQMQKLKGQ